MIERIAYPDVLDRMHKMLGKNCYTLHFIKTLDNGKIQAQFRPRYSA